MSNLVKPDNSIAIIDPANDWGNLFEDIQQTNLPHVTIGQPMSQGKELGAFNFSNKWPALKELKNLVIVYPHKSRVLYGPTFKSRSRCRSDNFHQPSQVIAEPITKLKDCARCYAKGWDSELGEEDLALKRALEKALNKKPNVTPLCKESIDLVMVDERMIPFSFAFQSTQLKMAREKILGPVYYGNAEEKRPGGRPFQTMFDLSIKEVNDKGRQFVSVPSNFRRLDAEQEVPYKELFNMFQKSGEQRMASQRNALDAEKDVSESMPDFEVYDREGEF